MRIVLDLLRSNWVEFEQELTARSILKSSEASWKLLRQWKDGTSTWVSLKDMKESFPVESAEYAVNNKIAEEPSFAWWAHKVPRKRRRVTQRSINTGSVHTSWESDCRRVSTRHCRLSVAHRFSLNSFPCPNRYVLVVSDNSSFYA